MAAVEQFRELIIRVSELLEAIFPESHVFEGREHLRVRFNPIRTGERHQQEQTRDVG